MFRAFRNNVQLQVSYSLEKGLSITGVAAHPSQERALLAIAQSELLIANSHLTKVDGLATEWEVRDYFTGRGWKVEVVV